MGVSKNCGKTAQIIHLFIGVWNHYFHHPFWGITIFGNTHVDYNELLYLKHCSRCSEMMMNQFKDVFVNASCSVPLNVLHIVDVMACSNGLQLCFVLFMILRWKVPKFSKVEDMKFACAGPDVALQHASPLCIQLCSGPYSQLPCACPTHRELLRSVVCLTAVGGVQVRQSNNGEQIFGLPCLF